MLKMTSIFANERPIPSIEGRVIMRNNYYDPAVLQKTADWARSEIASGKRDAWAKRYLQAEIERIELALRTGKAA
jgi:hypothetical protein